MEKEKYYKILRDRLTYRQGQRDNHKCEGEDCFMCAHIERTIRDLKHELAALHHSKGGSIINLNGNHKHKNHGL